jgi:hypothetical protein
VIRDELVAAMAAALSGAECICRTGRNQYGGWYLMEPTCPRCGDSTAKASLIYDQVLADLVEPRS